MADPRRHRRIRGQRRGMGAASQGVRWAKEARTPKTKLHSRTAGSLSVAASCQAGRPCQTCHLVAPMRLKRWARVAL